jgi:hypothetical protein
MKDNGNIPSRITPKSKQIKSEISSAPLNTSKKTRKENFQIYREIISALLKHESLTEGEIGDACGYKNKGKNKHQNVTRQIKILVEEWKYIEHVPISPSKYQIKRDLNRIRYLYDDKQFFAIRSDFPASTWLMVLLVKEHMEEYSPDTEFIQDLKKMMTTSSSMFYFFLRSDAHLNENLGMTLGTPIPLVKTPGLNAEVLVLLTRKCSIYDLFVTCMYLDHEIPLTSKNLPGTSRRIFDEMKHKSEQSKLKAINYIMSFTMMQNLIRCINTITDNKGQIPPNFEELVVKFNAITERINSETTDGESLLTAVNDMGEFYEKTSKLLDSSIPLDRRSGQIAGMGKVWKTSMK